jgi:hypothetical protein
MLITPNATGGSVLPTREVKWGLILCPVLDLKGSVFKVKQMRQKTRLIQASFQAYFFRIEPDTNVFHSLA